MYQLAAKRLAPLPLERVVKILADSPYAPEQRLSLKMDWYAARRHAARQHGR
jgi:hypothetical protein